jgi:hypothetical protein
MYYKVLKNNKVIDVLDNLIYLKWQPKHKIMVLSDENEAQAILSSDNNSIWHEVTLYNIPVDAGKFDSVEVVEIDEHEYKQLKVLNMKTPEAIIDEYNLLLLEMGVI